MNNGEKVLGGINALNRTFHENGFSSGYRAGNNSGLDSSGTLLQDNEGVPNPLSTKKEEPCLAKV
jgi:hypothetical protein